MTARGQGQGVEQPLVGAGLRRPRRLRDEDGDVLEALGQEGQPAQRRGVRPVQIVGLEQQRRARGQVGHEPDQALQRGEGVAIGLRRGAGDAEHRGGRLGGAGQKLGGRGGLALEELAHEPEGEGAVELRAAGAEHPQARGLSDRAGGAQELGLAHPRLGLDDEQSPLTRGRGGDQALDQRDLAVALEQGGLAGRRAGHARSLP